MTMERRVAILVVEDDPLLLLDAVDMFEDQGFVVHSACDACQAIRKLHEHSDIGILFTDIDMPGSMDGLALAHAVRDRWPPVTIMVTSGLRSVTLNDLPDGGTFFPKPYSPETVVTAVIAAAAEMRV